MKIIENNINKNNTMLKLYYIYKGFKLAIFLLNAFVIYSVITNNPKLLTLSLIFNIIYILIYYQRLWIIIPAGLISFYLTNDIYLSICLGFSVGNFISYIIDFIILTLWSIILNIINKLDKNK